ncbi:MAG: helix-turn-helix transcriptional regulator [Firmicutes bacterium]|nr:helix-turn-helix transcriptional regulator [Bacillota bacterium]
MDRKTFGKRLNQVRKSRGLTSEKLSELCYLNATYIRQIEAGTKTPSLPVFVPLCKELKVSPTYLLAGEFDSTEIDDMEILLELWQKASPSEINIITSIIESALKTM